jgi:hypothetical protein
VREKEMGMAKSKQFMQSPRIEVALLPDDNGDINNPSSLFDIWMILHVPIARSNIPATDGPAYGDTKQIDASNPATQSRL